MVTQRLGGQHLEHSQGRQRQNRSTETPNQLIRGITIMETTAGSTVAAPASNAPQAAYPWLTCYPAGVDWAQQMVGEPIPVLLERAVKTYADRPCTNFLGKRLTYGEIGALVDRATAGLKRIGVTKGMKVGLFLPNCPTFIVYYFAILKAGGVVVNYNPLYSLSRLKTAKPALW
jgi:long-chain acyl-CoA synthetase